MKLNLQAFQFHHALILRLVHLTIKFLALRQGLAQVQLVSNQGMSIGLVIYRQTLSRQPKPALCRLLLLILLLIYPMHQKDLQKNHYLRGLLPQPSHFLAQLGQKIIRLLVMCERYLNLLIDEFLAKVNFFLQVKISQLKVGPIQRLH